MDSAEAKRRYADAMDRLPENDPRRPGSHDPAFTKAWFLKESTRNQIAANIRNLQARGGSPERISHWHN